MSLFAQALFHARALFRKRKMDAQLSEEIRVHVDMAVEANLAKGMAPEEARYAALKEFGNVAGWQEEAREGRGGIWWEQLGKDVRFAARSLVRARSFSLTVIGTLALGIGVATMVFKLVAPALLLPFAFPKSDELYLLGQREETQSETLRTFVLAAQFKAYSEQTDVFREFAVLRINFVNALVGGEPVMAVRHQISRDFFQTLSVKPAFGRTFLPDEFVAGNRQVAVISDQFWRAHFHADPNVLGQSLIVDREPCTVIGVLRPGQLWPSAFAGGEILQPMATSEFVSASQPLSALFIMGRLRSGVSAAQAREALDRVEVPGFTPGVQNYFQRMRADLVSLRDLRFPGKHTWILIAAAALLYLTAGLNAVNLMLVRLLGRKQELSIRLALGGSRGRIVRLLALESAGLAAAATGVVLVAAKWVFPTLLFLLTKQDTVGSPLLNWTVFGCIAGLGILACLGIVTLPALRLARADLQPGLKDGGGAGLGESRSMARVRGLLVILQAALAVILLSGAGLMVRSFEKIRGTDLGLNPTGLVKVQLDMSRGLPSDFGVRLQVFDRLQQKLSTLPGVKGVTFGEDTVMSGGFWGREQALLKDGTYLSTTGSYVAADFYRVAGLTMQRGRWFSEDHSQNEVVLSETMAKALYGDDDPIERVFKLKAYPENAYRVVGVVRDVRESVRSPSGMRFYAPCWWYPPLVSTIILRLEREPEKEFTGLVRHALYDFDPTLLAYNISSLNDSVDQSLWSELFAYRVLKVLAAIALGLAMVGIFATVAYTVSCKRREFGVRLALGAEPGDLHRLVLRRSLMLVITGILAGIAAALGLTRFMQSLLFETAASDPLVHLTVALLLLAMAVLASWLPARRAAKVDPVVALRAE